jgi:hypothetical protein
MFFFLKKKMVLQKGDPKIAQKGGTTPEEGRGDVSAFYHFSLSLFSSKFILFC